VLAAICFFLNPITPSYSYSLFAHEALVDALWDVELKPILVARFPGATSEQLKEAHSYAYGGAVIQDMGYYPRGNQRFSDLTHYVRTGDFIVALVSESQNIDELAFALGALSHYLADVDGHRFATNPGEPLVYPKLQREYGNFITYEQNPGGHIKTEFGFDVLEIAKGNFAPQAYHDFIGFNVAKLALERAFRDTYGLELKDLFKDFDRTVGSFRRAASKTIPKATRIAWAERKDEIQRANPGVTEGKFVYVMKRSSYEREWGKQYDRPSASDHILAFLVKLLPPVGPLRALRFRMLTPEVEKLFMLSFDRSTAACRAKAEAAAQNRLQLENTNYDVGTGTGPGQYRLNDDTHAYWLDKLAEKNFSNVTPAIQIELVSFYSNLNAPLHTKKHSKDWTRLLAELERLKTAKIPAAINGGQ